MLPPEARTPHPPLGRRLASSPQERTKNDSLLAQLAESEAKCERTYESGTMAAGREATKVVDRFAERTNELVRDLSTPHAYAYLTHHVNTCPSVGIPSLAR